jgi:hypothetical protein
MNKIVFTLSLLGLTLYTSAQTLNVTPSVPRGILQAPTTVVLSAPAGATIRYTTNFSMPSRTNGTVYTQPIVVNANTVLKTFTYSGAAESKVQSFTYIFPNKGGELHFPNLVSPADYANGLKQLPIVSISIPTGGLPVDSKTEQMCSFEYINKSGENSSIGVLGGVEGYGSDSYITSEQKNLRVKFKSKYGYSDLSYPIFQRDDADSRNPVTKFDVLDLKIGQDGPNADGYCMLMSSQGLISKTMRELGNVDLHTKYAHAFVNGKYHGVYTLKEKYDDNFGAAYYGGNKDMYDEIEGDWEFPIAKPGSSLANLDALRAAAKQNRYQDVKKYLNVSQFIDYMILMMYFDNEWEYRIVGHKQLLTTKLTFENHDTDGALTKTSDDNEFAYDLKWTNGSKVVLNGPFGIFGDLLRGNNPEFKALLRERVFNALQKPNAPLTPARIQQKLAAMRAIVRPAFNMELARFNRTFYNSFEQEYAANVAHLPTRYQYNLNKWLGVLNGTLRPVAAESADNQSFVVSPNPAQDYLDVDLKAGKDQFAELTVYNVLGAPVLKRQVEQANSTYRLPLQELQTGQYILAIQTAGQQTTTRKFVVSR